MAENSFKTFPSSRTEALAMLYLQNQDLSGKSPKEIQEMFLIAYKEMREASSDKTFSEFSPARIPPLLFIPTPR